MKLHKRKLRTYFEKNNSYINEIAKNEEETGNDSLQSQSISEPISPDIKNIKINSLGDEFDKLFKIWIGQKKADAGYIDEDEDSGKEFLLHIESGAITTFYNELILYKTKIENAYRDQLWKKNLWYPRKWMLENIMIYKLIKKYKICEILNEIEKRNTVKNKTPFRYLFQVDEPKYKGKHPYACFITNQGFYDLILPELKIKKITLQKYLMALCKVGAIKKINKTGRSDVRKNETLYAVGYLVDYTGTKNRLIRFLTQKNKKQLAEFSMP